MSAAAVAQRLWTDPGLGASLARAALLPLGAVYRLGVLARNAAYDSGALESRPLPLPSVGIGNLAVGGAGKTPLAWHVARRLAAASGATAAILARGYGDDETRAGGDAPDVLVIADADRLRGAERARDLGAGVVVLDDCLQRRDVAVDVMLALVAAESWRGERWPLPAGPWREGAGALWRADAVVVTRKTAPEHDAAAIAAELASATGGRYAVADIAIAALAPLAGGPARPVDWLKGKRVVAISGVASPKAFTGQLAMLGADVEAVDYGDHHAYDAAEVRGMIALAAGRPIITTSKDAVKLAGLWPAGVECLVAVQEVRLTEGRAVLEDLLHRVARAARTFTQTGAAPGSLHHT